MNSTTTLVDPKLFRYLMITILMSLELASLIALAYSMDLLGLAGLMDLADVVSLADLLD